MGHSECDGAVPACTAAEVRRMMGLIVTYQTRVSVDSSRRTAGDPSVFTGRRFF